jgi:hypothetical protein
MCQCGLKNNQLIINELKRQFIWVHFKFTRFYCLTLILSEGEANGW